jgi:hypothetical protein
MEDKNIAYKTAIILCMLLFSVFLVVLLLRNREKNPVLALDTNNDNQNIKNDWKNVFGDLQTAFEKLVR